MSKKLEVRVAKGLASVDNRGTRPIVFEGTAAQAYNKGQRDGAADVRQGEKAKAQEFKSQLIRWGVVVVGLVAAWWYFGRK